jgi:uncharacterized membrane protein
MPESPQEGQPVSTAGSIRRNIAEVARLEEDFIRNRTPADRIADLIARFSGGLTFVVFHAVFYGLWILINLRRIPGIPVFDPYPFMLLSTVVSLEAIFLSTFVLMKQNRMSARADQREHLDLQINLLAEREMTMVLRMLQRISVRLGVPLATTEIEEMCKETSVAALASDLKEMLPEE